MIQLTVSERFKENILKFGRLISVRITFNDGTVYEKDNITYCSKAFEGEPFKSVMQYVDIELKNPINVKNKEFDLEFGVKAEENENYEYLNWGRYIVDNDSIEKKIDTKTTKFTAYDYLKNASKLYTELEIEYPVTLKEFLAALCDVLGFSLQTEKFANCDKLLYDDRFIGTIKYTYRDILDHIAGAAGGIVFLKGAELYIKYPYETGYLINENNLKTLSLANRFGPLNSLALSIQPKNDTMYRQDENSIEVNGTYEVELINNAVINSSRGDFVTELYEHVTGLEFYQFDLESFGYAFFEPYDLVTICDLDGISHKSLILSNSVTVTTGLTETIGCQIDNPKVTDYTKKDDVQTLIKDTTDELQDTVYYFTNDDTLKISETSQEIIRIRFTSKIQTTPMFNANIICKVDVPGLLEFTYILDNVDYYVHPKQNVLEGWHTIHLFLPIYQLQGNMSHDLVVMVNSKEAQGTITRNQIQATVNGQGLEVINNEWDGTIKVITEVDPVLINSLNTNISIANITASPLINTQLSDVSQISLNMTPVQIGNLDLGIGLGGIESSLLFARVIVNELINFNYLTKQLFIYDSNYVEFNESSVLLKTEYVLEQTNVIEIDSGRLQELHVDLAGYKEVYQITVEVEE